MILPQRVHDALIAILREHQPQAAGRLLLDLEELIGRELAAEREACAQVADDTTHQPMDYIGWSPGPAADDRARAIATAIRARTEGGTE